MYRAKSKLAGKAGLDHFCSPFKFLGLAGWPGAHPVIESDITDVCWVIRGLLCLLLTSAFSKRNGKHDPASAQSKNFGVVEFHAPSNLGWDEGGGDKAIWVSGFPEFFKSYQTVTPLLKHQGLQRSTFPLDMKSIPSSYVLNKHRPSKHVAFLYKTNTMTCNPISSQGK